MTEENEHKVLTKAAYEHLVAAVGQMLEEGKKAGQQADRSNHLISGVVSALALLPTKSKNKFVV